MKVAHETILGGHQGAKRTRDKVLSDFFWPGVHGDITRFCRSCDVCQRTTPKGKTSKVPLGRMPLIQTPFERVAIDIIGPLSPTSSKGNRYVLTLVDFATRYPEAVPLPSIETTRVAEALINIFSRVGIPKEILTDRGAQFTSDLMREISRLLSIRQLATSPYHPACNGLVERFNGTIKTMIKRMCVEKPKDWDRYLSPLLFAYRETPQASLGFSPFELIYGRTVRGPMSILRELWVDEANTPEVRTTYEYILDLRNRIEETCELASRELAKATERYKGYADKRSRDRTFKVGDKVLLLLPSEESKLLMQWKGPFVVTSKVGDVDYRIQINGKIKTFHANLLKKYFERCESINSGQNSEPIAQEVFEKVAVSIIEPEPFTIEHNPENLPRVGILHERPNLVATESIDDVHSNEQLSTDQIKCVKRILGNFKDNFTDLPGCTNLGTHDIKLTCDVPICLKPYPIPHALEDIVKSEVKIMRDMGIIEPSRSPYSSPIVLVKKPDGKYRFCADFRRLNNITIFDAEPIPNPESIFAKLSNAHYFTKLDLCKGYWQLPLAEGAREKTAFRTQAGLFQFKMMPFGLINAPASFSRLVRSVLENLTSVDNYIDDILIHTTSWEEHLQLLTLVLHRLRDANLNARPSKCYIAMETIDFLGHIVGKGTVKPQTDKLNKIKAAPIPTTKKQLQSFLGLTGYYRDFIPDFAKIAVPLTNKIKAQQPNQLVWDPKSDLAFNELKHLLTSAPILHLPDTEKPFVLRTDASNVGLGAVLLQEHVKDIFPVAYASRKLLPREMNYSTIERECLGAVWGIQKFKNYLYGRHFVLQTDHQPLSYMQKARVSNSRIMRWALSLQSYRFTIQAINGSENVGADYLSRQ